MRTLRTMIAVALGLACGCTSAPAAPTDDGDDAEERLRSAHEAYLNGEPAELARDVGLVLADAEATDSVRENAAALLERAWSERGGTLPTGEALPEGIRDLMVDVIRRTEPDALAFRIVVRGEADPGAISDVTVETADGEVIAARTGGVGTWTRTGEEIELESPDLAALPDNVFFVRVWTTAGREHRYWVPVDALACSATPTVHRPAPWSTVGPRPELRWEDFRSPAHQPFERRTLGVWLGRRTAGLGVRYTTGRFFSEEPPTELVLDEDLPPGQYWLAVTFGEVRQLGPVRVRRLCRTSLPFEVEAS